MVLQFAVRTRFWRSGCDFDRHGYALDPPRYHFDPPEDPPGHDFELPDAILILRNGSPDAL